MVKLVSKIVQIDNKKTCIRLCNKEWIAIDEICLSESVKRSTLIENIKSNKNQILGLTAAVRLFTMLYFQNQPKLDNTIHKINYLLDTIK